MTDQGPVSGDVSGQEFRPGDEVAVRVKLVNLTGTGLGDPDQPRLVGIVLGDKPRDVTSTGTDLIIPNRYLHRAISFGLVELVFRPDPPFVDGALYVDEIGIRYMFAPGLERSGDYNWLCLGRVSHPRHRFLRRADIGGALTRVVSMSERAKL